MKIDQKKWSVTLDRHVKWMRLEPFERVTLQCYWERERERERERVGVGVMSRKFVVIIIVVVVVVVETRIEVKKYK